MLHKLGLVKKLIKNHGFVKTVWLLFRMVFFKVCDINFAKKNRQFIKDKVKGKRVVVFAKNLEWNNMFQRTQQMALSFSRQENTVVIYVETCTTHDFFANINPISDSLICYSFHHYKALGELLDEANQVVLYLTNLFELDTNLELKHDKLVYEYVDELEIFFTDMELANERHARVLAQADLCTATATKLFLQIEPIAKKAILSPNAVDFDIFSKAKTTPVAPQIAGISGKYSMVLGYYGALANWFDFALVTTVAKKRPNWLFVLIGVIFDDTIDKYNLSDYKNILILPPQPYASLPSFISGIDVLTIPFLINNITESTSPVKLFEYMASGTPILTSRLPECMKYESVYHYTDAVKFIEQAEYLYTIKDTPRYKQLLLKEAQENTWTSRAQGITDALEAR